MEPVEVALSDSASQANAGLVKPKQLRNDSANKSTWDRPWGLKETSVFQGAGLWSHDLCVPGHVVLSCEPMAHVVT